MKIKILIVSILLLALAGCTIRGGWPRFLRKGESWGWSGAKPDPKPASTNQLTR